MNHKKINGKIIFITGGVLSSLGKGIFSASIASIFKERGLKINMMKFDPYLNVDPGTISPIEHGEVFVTKDGGETDLDIGHYERFINQNFTKNSSISSGKIYSNLIEDERKGKYLGKTVQIIPNVIDKIIEIILKNLQGYDLLIVEIGGTVGDIESIPYFETIRQLQFQRENVINIHIGFIPYLSVNKEYKSKPFQHSIKQLHSLGVFPNFLVTRSEEKIPTIIIDKISANCSVHRDYIFELENVENVYQIPQKLVDEKIDQKIAQILNLNLKYDQIKNYQLINKLILSEKIGKIKIAIIGKYHNLKDSYLSIIETLKIITLYKKLDLDLLILDSKDINLNELKDSDGIIISGGFGIDGTEGKLKAIRYARENNIPFLGICYGMQLAILEFARNVLKLDLYHQEINPEKEGKFIIHLLENQNLNNLGGTMRLGEYNCKIFDNTLAKKIYKKDLIKQRHRHRYEFNNFYKEKLEKEGLIFSGINPENNLFEIIEYPKNDFFLAVQFHPEFNTTLYKLDNLFSSFIDASYKHEEKEEIIKKDKNWIKDKIGLSNNVYYKDNIICKFFKNNDFTKVYGNQEIDLLKELNLFKNLKTGKNYFCVEKINHKIFNTEKASEKIIINCAIEINRLHNIKINKNTNLKIPNFYDTWNFLNKQNKVLKYPNEEVILKEALNILNQDLVYANNDIVDGNILILKNNKIKIIDYEYGGINSKYFDLASFVVKRKLTKEQEEIFLNTYINLSKNFDYQKFVILRIFTAYFWAKWARYKYQESNQKIYDEIADWLVLRGK